VVCDRYGVRDLRKKGLSYDVIAAKLELSKSTVARIARATAA
jgi:ribosome-binding protein aMBF1 (putative translation factor)